MYTDGTDSVIVCY